MSLCVESLPFVNRDTECLRMLVYFIRYHNWWRQYGGGEKGKTQEEGFSFFMIAGGGGSGKTTLARRCLARMLTLLEMAGAHFVVVSLLFSRGVSPTVDKGPAPPLFEADAGTTAALEVLRARIERSPKFDGAVNSLMFWCVP